ncbi:MAG TPA: hypothetical protein PK358_07715 [Spirochaetota bacterium]|nr:hypothetical protein [Spirochaetota bacterium]HPJ34706.1 hypothetical protein [Spirochaetota bacterium]
MNERIDIPDGEEKILYTERFREIAKSFKRKGWLFVIIAFIITIIIIASYTTGRVSAMDLTITVAIMSVLSFPFILSAFNKGSQLISDIESDRVQIVTGIVTKIKSEKKRSRTLKLLILDRAKIYIDEKYCKEFQENDRIRIVRGVSSRIAVLAELDAEVR